LAITANDFVAAGAFVQRSGGETSSASQVYLRGMSAPDWNAALVRTIFRRASSSAAKKADAAVSQQTMPIW
jgi:hypothetical protein